MAPRRIVVFGSSSIYGSEDVELGGFVNRLRLWYETVNPRNRVYNLGIWGEQTRDMCERVLREAPPRRPDLIMVYPGFNDCRRDGTIGSPNAVSLNDYRETIDRMVANSQSIAETIVLTGIPFDETRTAPYGDSQSYYLIDDAAKYNKALVETASSRNARLLDFFTLFQHQDMDALLADDGLHCNACGHEVMFKFTRDFLRETFLVGDSGERPS